MQIEVEDATGDSTSSNRQEDATEEESDLRDYQLARDRQKRESRPPRRFGYAYFIAYALTAAEEVDCSEPTSYQEAMNCKDVVMWMQAIEEEKLSLMKYNTWTIVRRPAGKK